MNSVIIIDSASVADPTATTTMITETTETTETTTETVDHEHPHPDPIHQPPPPIPSHPPTAVAAVIKVSDKERAHYARAWDAGACNFETPEFEYEWAGNQYKKCSKCSNTKSLTDFMNNTSGRDAFDKNKYRLRRPECRACTKTSNQGKNQAVKLAKAIGISCKAPEGTECELCHKTSSIVFDHDHEKNVFRGWLCDPCNRSMGVLGDSAPSLLSTVAYLAKDNAVAQDLIAQLRAVL